ncbi:coiled-coil domain-containing protein [Anthocerotibacter panamensis]|uniref:hypothetical protein n=1 Tax=Anthocerotibacter panamensis TaxID=2857077 RepID=UPI001C403FB8|nr:hypothetical protein [Anthocerotibacter panamensis]
MRHLGIVQKKGMMGGAAELQIFAREEGEFLWRAWNRQIPADKVLADKLSRLVQGAMVMVEMAEGGQVQRVDVAEEQLLALLQGFGRQLESFKNQTQEIETWRESLQYQAEALTFREQEWQNREHDLLTEIAQLRAGNGKSQDFENLQKEWVRLESERQQLVYERQQLEEDRFRLEQASQPFADPGTLSAIQQEISHLTTHLEGQATSQNSYENVLNELLQLIEFHLSQLFEWLDELTASLAAAHQEAQELEIQGHILAKEADQLSAQQAEHLCQEGKWQAQTELLQQQHTALEPLLTGLNASQTHLRALLNRCGGEAEDKPTLTPEELERRRRRWGDQQREYLQRANLVLQQDEELRLQHEQLEQLQEKLDLCQQQEADPNELADVEDEIDFTRQACADLRESLARQKVRMAQDEALLNQERDLLTRLVAQQEGRNSTPPNPHSPLLPDLTQLLSTFNPLQQSIQERVNDLETRGTLLARTRDQLDREAAQWQQQQAKLLERQSLHIRDCNANNTQRAALQTRLTTLEERRQLLESQQAILIQLHQDLPQTPDVHYPVHVLGQVSSHLASLA